MRGGMKSSVSFDMPGNRLGQWHEQSGTLADPIRQGRAIQFNAGTGVDGGLPVQRSMIAIFADQHMGEQCRSRPAALDG